MGETRVKTHHRNRHLLHDWCQPRRETVLPGILQFALKIIIVTLDND